MGGLFEYTCLLDVAVRLFHSYCLDQSVDSKINHWNDDAPAALAQCSSITDELGDIASLLRDGQKQHVFIYHIQGLTGVNCIASSESLSDQLRLMACWLGSEVEELSVHV